MRKAKKANWLERDLLIAPYLCLCFSQAEFNQAPIIRRLDLSPRPMHHQ
jgi:hypothetical protein